MKFVWVLVWQFLVGRRWWGKDDGGERDWGWGYFPALIWAAVTPKQEHILTDVTMLISNHLSPIHSWTSISNHMNINIKSR